MRRQARGIFSSSHPLGETNVDGLPRLWSLRTFKWRFPAYQLNYTCLNNFGNGFRPHGGGHLRRDRAAILVLMDVRAFSLLHKFGLARKVLRRVRGIFSSSYSRGRASWRFTSGMKLAWWMSWTQVWAEEKVPRRVMVCRQERVCVTHELGWDIRLAPFNLVFIEILVFVWSDDKLSL